MKEQEVEEAASCLLQMKHAELDTHTLKELRYLINQNENENRKGKDPMDQEYYENRKRKRTNYKNSVLEDYETNENQNGSGRFDPSWVPTRQNQISPSRRTNDRISLPKPPPRPRTTTPSASEKGKEIVTYENEALLEPDPKFLKKLPSIGKGIDRIPLPSHHPIHSLQGQIGQCSKPFEKQLTISDLNKSQARLAICKEAVEDKLKPFMNKKEISELANTKSMKVTVYDQTGREYEMYFKLWAEKMHVISGKWNEFCSDNRLKAHLDWVTIWMFRRTDLAKLCIAIVARRFDTENLIGKPQKNGNKIKQNEEED